MFKTQVIINNKIINHNCSIKDSLVEKKKMVYLKVIPVLQIIYR